MAPATSEHDPMRLLVGKGLVREVLCNDGGELDDAHAGMREVKRLLLDSGAEVLRIYSVVNPILATVYEAVRGASGSGKEMDLWHGTTPDSLGNIVMNGFNRAYVGRHGTKLGLGTYFSADVEYSLRFCGRRGGQAHRYLVLARVLVGRYTKGSADLVEPPFCGEGQLERFDSVVDNMQSPSIFCIFRDFQALPCYIVQVA